MKFEIVEIILIAAVFFILGYGVCAIRASQVNQDRQLPVARETFVTPIVHWPGNP